MEYGVVSLHCTFKKGFAVNQFQTLATTLTLLNRYYSLLRASGTTIPEASVICEVVDELFAPRLVLVKGIYRWSNKPPEDLPHGKKQLSQAGSPHVWLVPEGNKNIIVDVLPVLALKGFETPVVLEQQEGSSSRGFIGYFPSEEQTPRSKLTTVTLNTVRLQMEAILRDINPKRA